MYQVTEWSPNEAPTVVAETESLKEVIDVAKECYSAQITADHWGANPYICTYAEGGAAAKLFQSCIPEDAEIILTELT